MRHISDAVRRSRIARRHALAPEHRLDSPVAATTAMTVLHATEPPTVYLSLWARVADLQTADVDRALFEDRSLVKQLAMRRTLFVFPRDLLPAAWGSASHRISGPLRARLAQDIVDGGLAEDGEAWLKAASAAVLDRLGGGEALTAVELREQVPEVDGYVDLAPGTKWGRATPIAPRVLGQLAMEAAIVRGRNTGHWRVSRPRWTTMADWLGETPQPWSAAEGYAELVRRWLDTFGPGTTTDLRWWLGATQTIVRRALADVDAVEVSLDDGGTGWVLPGDDSDEPEHDEAWAALLPVLDATAMGWKERDFYLGHATELVDRNGNIGTTAWWDGRVVGCWVQDQDGAVRLRLLEEVPPAGREALGVEAERLGTWLAGERVGTVYQSPAMRAAG